MTKGLRIFASIQLLAYSVMSIAAENPTAKEQPPLSAASILEDVATYSTDPHYFDWRRIGMELEFAYDYVDEANNFETDGGHLGISIPMSGGLAFRFGLRRFFVYGTKASNQLARTPFKQPALANRYEIYAGAGYGLIEGRSFTRLSPWLSDLSQVLSIEGAAHYNHNNDGWVPKRKDQSKPLPGQDRQSPRFVAEIGLRWTVYFPETFGLYYEVREHFPLGNSQIVRWTHFNMGMVWATGYK